MPEIYTRQGDEGETGLLYGGRISKSDPRCEAYGTIDEAVASMGLARSLLKCEDLYPILKGIQKELFTVGAELATDPSEYGKLTTNFSTVTGQMVKNLENLIDKLKEQLNLPRAFIIPGSSSGSSALDLSRSIVRRAERHVVKLKELNYVENHNVLIYLNRLSDLLFVMARYEDKDVSIEALTD
ncbi:MAG: cob(I)yrinic acid a,c-diamide adenosyltransferase [SAR202 cluster bacterium]|nr:cob(I)yrinic acid a,c-diamide adenosyltransferase [SAR202 cluster bacterium]